MAARAFPTPSSLQVRVASSLRRVPSPGPISVPSLSVFYDDLGSSQDPAHALRVAIGRYPEYSSYQQLQYFLVVKESMGKSMSCLPFPEEI